MHDARAGVGQQGVGRDQPDGKLLDLLRGPVGSYPVKAIGGKLGREFPRQRAVQAAEAGPGGRVHELGKLPSGVGHRRAMDSLALEGLQLGAETGNERRRLRVGARPDLGHGRLAEIAETGRRGVGESAANALEDNVAAAHDLPFCCAFLDRCCHQLRKECEGTLGNSRPRVQAPSLSGCQGRYFAIRTPRRTAHIARP